MPKSKLEEAIEKYDEKTQERLAEQIISLAEEEPMSSGQKNCIRVLKVICPIGLIFGAPIVTFIYAQLAQGLEPLIFWLSIVPLLFLAIITTIVDVLLKTPK